MPKPQQTSGLRTLPERAFRVRARLVAVLMCIVCFAGLAARLAYLQLFAGGWYTDRALGQQLRDTVVPADRGRIFSSDGVLLAANSSCWTLRASPREMPEEKLSLAAHGLAEILELDEGRLLEKFSDRRSNDCLLRYRVEGFLRRKRHHRHPHQSGFQAVVPAGGVSGVGAGLYQCRQRRCGRAGAEIQ